MGKLINYDGQDKVKRRIADVLNVKDVQTNGVSIVDNNGVANITTIPGNAKILVATQADWDRQRTLIAAADTIYVYSDHDIVDGKNIPAIKIGDGTSYLIDMAYVTDHVSELLDHINNRIIHVTEEEKQFWNNKARCDESQVVSNKRLIFTTH
ncbi:MAG: hypothetical protein IJH82_06300 [Lachnospiraceae bacterium]|nr:hypothetical protein [Lachnospiraceae bacterium]